VYGVTGPLQGHSYIDEQTKELKHTLDAYSRPQVHACFISSISDCLLNGKDGIMDTFTKEARIFKYGSGSGINYSSLRGAGEKLSGGGTSSGVLSWLKIGDATAGAIKSGGTTRRAARMTILNDDHPDVCEFITWKQREELKAKALIAMGYDSHFEGEAYSTITGQNANNSVRLTDRFMEAVEKDEDWNLIRRTDGKVHRTLKARHIWNLITKAAWDCADPGLQFDTTINNMNTCSNSGRINASNPCISGSTRILTNQGLQLVTDLIGKSFVAVLDGKEYTSTDKGFWSSGIKQTFNITLDNGLQISATDNHPFLYNSGAGFSMTEVKNMKPGCTIQMANNTGYKWSGGNGTYEEGYFCGQLTGDGSFDNECPITIKHSEKKVNEQGSYEYTRGLIRGFFDAHGTVVDDQNRDISVRLGQVDLERLKAIQRLLFAMGIYSNIHKNRLPRDIKMMPDGKGGQEAYISEEFHELIISKSELVKFHEIIGFTDNFKTAKLAALIAAYKRKPNKTKFESKIFSIETDTVEEVFDCTINNIHCFNANGMVTHNCSEYMHLDDSACNLASHNTERFVDHPSKIFHYDSWVQEVDLWTRVLDISVSYAAYPSDSIAWGSYWYRTLGLGYANIGTTLMCLGLPYDSDEGRATAAFLTSLMTAQSYLTSAQLARDIGAFPKYAENKEPCLAVIKKHAKSAHDIVRNNIHPTFRSHYDKMITLWSDAYTLAETYGVRNGQVTLLAPTGTISFIMDCETTGLECDFALVKYKTMAGGGYMKIINRAVEPALRALNYTESDIKTLVTYLDTNGRIEDCPLLKAEHQAVFETAVANSGGKRFISPMGHIKMMAAVQPFLSGAISKTVNMPESSTIENVSEVYMQSWKLGIKAVALYRDNCKGSQVLSTTIASTSAVETKINAESKDEASIGLTSTTVLANPNGLTHVKRRKLPSIRNGKTIGAEVSGQKVFIHTGEYPDGTLGEVFIDTYKQGSPFKGLLDLLSISTSLGLQHGVPLRKYIDKFTLTQFEPAGSVKHPFIKSCTSIPDYVFRELGRLYLNDYTLIHIKPDNTIEEDHDNGAMPQSPPLTYGPSHAGPLCKFCGHATVMSGTCHKCMNCGMTSGCG
jgi:ribonucleotide reductase alpha subunit